MREKYFVDEIVKRNDIFALKYWKKDRNKKGVMTGKEFNNIFPLYKFKIVLQNDTIINEHNYNFGMNECIDFNLEWTNSEGLYFCGDNNDNNSCEYIIKIPDDAIVYFCNTDNARTNKLEIIKKEISKH